MITFPEEFDNRMKKMLGQEYEAFCESFEKPFHNGIRFNSLKVSPADMISQDGFDQLTRVPWTDNGFYMDKEKRFFSSHPFYHSGLYYIQEASAMLPAKLMKAGPGQKILDMCAAPGGKSTEIAAAMKGEGLLISNDVSRSRAKALVHNIETMGAVNCIVTSAMPDKLASLLPEYFDGILIDAPCSGEGMFHKEPSMMESWKRTGPDFYHNLQKEILTSAAAMLSPGGRLVYSTCTFSPQEDEGTIAWFLEQYPEFSLVEIDPDSDLFGSLCIDHGNPDWLDLIDSEEERHEYSDEIKQQLRRTLRLWPHHLEGEGHFAAVLVKEGESVSDISSVSSKASKSKKSFKVPKIPSGKKELEPFYEFLKEVKITKKFIPDRIRYSGGYVQYLPQYQPSLNGIHILRNGWFLGEIKKGRFEPSGAFARGLFKNECGKTVSFSYKSEQVAKYLRCETLDADSDMNSGWNLVCSDQASLGWCKISGGNIKNKYPAGWRIV